jgi:very-short-patch-repair endonuclease
VPHERARQLAEVQDGLITRRQALAAAMSPAAIAHALRPGGPWQRVVRGVFATFTGPLSPLHRLRAARLYAGDAALVTGAWACWMSGLRYGPPTGDEVEMLVHRDVRLHGTGFVVVRRTVRLPEPNGWWGLDEQEAGLPVPPHVVLDPLAPSSRPGEILTVPTARAVIDTVVHTEYAPPGWSPGCRCRYGCREPGTHRVQALRNVRALMCEAVQRRKAGLAALQSEVDAAWRRGSALAKLALADIEAGCRSAPECELRDLVRRSRILPEPLWNRPLPGVRGIVPDACWPERRLIVEVDSRSFHGFGDAPERTEHRRARLAMLGWVVLPVSPARLRADPAGVLTQIEAAYLAGDGALSAARAAQRAP